MIRAVRFSTNRTLVLGDLDDSFDDLVQPPFATLVPAYGAAERQRVEALIVRLLDLGCVELCCVGPEAHLLEDAIDSIIEDLGELDVVTTAVTDPDEASAYFVSAVRGTPRWLLALVSSHRDVVATLENTLAALPAGAFESN